MKTGSRMAFKKMTTRSLERGLHRAATSSAEYIWKAEVTKAFMWSVRAAYTHRSAVSPSRSETYCSMPCLRGKSKRQCGQDCLQRTRVRQKEPRSGLARFFLHCTAKILGQRGSWYGRAQGMASHKNQICSLITRIVPIHVAGKNRHRKHRATPRRAIQASRRGATISQVRQKCGSATGRHTRQRAAHKAAGSGPREAAEMGKKEAAADSVHQPGSSDGAVGQASPCVRLPLT